MQLFCIASKVKPLLCSYTLTIYCVLHHLPYLGVLCTISITYVYAGNDAAVKVTVKSTPKLPTGFAKINQVSSGSPAQLAVSYMYRCMT